MRSAAGELEGKHLQEENRPKKHQQRQAPFFELRTHAGSFLATKRWQDVFVLKTELPYGQAAGGSACKPLAVERRKGGGGVGNWGQNLGFLDVFSGF